MTVRKRLLRKLARLVAEAEPRLLPTVTYKQITVCFSDRTVTINGRKIRTESDCLTMPILGGDAVFVSRDDMERIG